MTRLRHILGPITTASLALAWTVAVTACSDGTDHSADDASVDATASDPQPPDGTQADSTTTTPDVATASDAAQEVEEVGLEPTDTAEEVEPDVAVDDTNGNDDTTDDATAPDDTTATADDSTTATDDTTSPDTTDEDLSVSEDTSEPADTCHGCPCDPKLCLGTSSRPALSCAAILAAGQSLGDGAYWIDPDGDGPIAAVQAYCDMTTDGGGWLRVLGFTIADSVSKVPPWYEIGPGLEAAAQDTGLVRSDRVGNLMTAIGATELRFICQKPSVGRRIHITTAKPEVIAFLTGQTDARPSAPDTFTRSTFAGAEDTSNLTQHPSDWGGVNHQGQWGGDNPVPGTERLFNHPFYIHITTHWLLAVDRSECDDWVETSPAKNGNWRVYIR